MSDSSKHESLRALFSALADDRLDQRQSADLVARLREDPEARAEYLRFAANESLLPNEVAPDGPPALPDVPNLLADYPAPPVNPKPDGSAPGGFGYSSIWLAGGGLWLGGLALLLVVVFLQWGMWDTVNRPTGQRAEAPMAGEPPAAEAAGAADQRGPVDRLSLPSPPLVAARLVGVEAARWASLTGSLEPGAPLQVGTILGLEQGVAEVAFDSGAVVFLRGPARLELLSPLAAHLHEGQLSAVVPEEAIGFVIETEDAAIVDEGTEFSVSVEPEGSSEAFVHRGKIRIDARTDPQDRLQPWELNEGQGLRFARSGDEEAPVATPVPSEQGDRLRVGMKSTSWTTPGQVAGLRLWLRADAGTFLDPRHRTPAEPGDPIGRWLDQSGNGLSPMQTEPANRPVLVVDGDGRRALRFDGRSQWLQQPNTTGPTSQVLYPFDHDTKTQFTMFFVFTPASQGIFKEPRCLFGQFADSVNGASRRAELRAGRLNYDEWPPKGNWLSTDDQTVPPQQKMLACVVRDDRHRAIYLNGALAIEDDHAETYAGNNTRYWWVGARRLPVEGGGEAIQHFHGDLAEMIIFKRTLDATTRAAIEKYLLDRHFQRAVADHFPQAGADHFPREPSS